MVQISENLDFGHNFWNILNEVKIFEISRFWSKFWKSWFLWRFSKYLDFAQNCRQYRFQTKFSKNPHFRQNFRFISILMKLVKNLDFGQNYRKIAILVKMFESPAFSDAFQNTSISVKIFENHSLRQNFRKKKRFWTKLVKISKSLVNLDFIRNISILVQISVNLDFGQTFWKILIEVKIFEVSGIWPKFTKIAILGKYLWKSQSWGRFSKYLDFVQTFRKFQFGQNFRIISILLKFSKNLKLYQTFEQFGFWSIFSKNSDFGQNL